MDYETGGQVKDERDEESMSLSESFDEMPKFSKETAITTTTSSSCPDPRLDDRSTFTPHRKRRLIPFLQQRWEEMTQEFSHTIHMENHDHATTIQHHLHKLYRNGVPHQVLSALIHLAGGLHKHMGDRVQHESYEDRMNALSSYLLSFIIPKRNKLDCLRALAMVLEGKSNDDTNVLCETITDDTLQFITEPPGTTCTTWQPNWKDADMEVLFWELRAVCRRQWEVLAQRRRDCLTRLARSGEAAAEYITSTASWLERAFLFQSVPMIHNGIDNVGNFLTKLLTPAEHDALMAMSRNHPIDGRHMGDHRQLSHGKAAVILLIYSDAAKRATGNAKESVRVVLHGIRDSSTAGIHWVVHRMDEERVGERLITDPSSRDVLAAWGKVGLASLGATAIISEAMIEATKSIGQKLATVTAHVVEHKYGTLAGQVVQDSCDATGNVFRTVTYVMMFKTKVITKVIMRNTAKVQCRKQMNESEERRVSASFSADSESTQPET